MAGSTGARDAGLHQSGSVTSDLSADTADPLGEVLQARCGARLVRYDGRRVLVRSRSRPGEQMDLLYVLLADETNADGSWWTDTARLRAYLDTVVTA
ncbi:MAG: hypothetical protein HY332_16320 [Chloroflexi bacterium]|nr:hypothetical protein [Chloroflexota bacterium]